MVTAHIGTSGFSYSYWKNKFYPTGMPASRWLGYYSSRFNTVELNNTFYRFPLVKTLQKAAEAVGDNFRFSVKAHKVITHTLRMKQVFEKATEFARIALEGLGSKLKCILYQLPPTYSFSAERLNDIVNGMPAGVANVVELRHASWWNEETLKTFRDNDISFCSVSFPGLPADNIATTGIFYKRMHGVPDLFASPYSTDELQALADDIPEGTEPFIYFNNTMYEAGYSNAETLQDMMGSNVQACKAMTDERGER